MIINIDDLMELKTVKSITGKIFEDYNGIEFDSRRQTEGKLFVCLKGNKSDGHDFAGKALATGARGVVSDSCEKITSFGQEITLVLVESCEKFLLELANYMLLKNKIKVIAVTGSSGKTTTKEILYNYLSGIFKTIKTEGNFNNRLGIPWSILNSAENNADFLVAECGMNHSGELTEISEMLKPDIVLIINVGYVHSGNFKNIEDIAQAKFEIASGLKKNGFLIANKSINSILNFEKKFKNSISFGEEQDNFLSYTIIDFKHKKTRFIVNSQGKEQEFNLEIFPFEVENYAGAISVLLKIGIPLEKISFTIEKNFKENRMEKFQKDGFDFIFDCYNSNPHSLSKILPLLNMIAPKWIVILGDMKELGENSIYWHQKIGQIFADSVEGKLICYGDMAVMFGEGAIKNNRNIGDVYFTNSLEEVYKLIKFLGKDYNVFVKGSRSMQMEKLKEHLGR
ncbi:MAG: UDP-N-acetylmuramoyl-tripeptide--D-alanyl-D-alanine ligase [Candidatus Muiribacteriota bacterium]